MQILVKDTATGSVQTLCHGHGTGVDKHVGPSDLITEGPISVQMAEFLRATNAKAYSRGNRKARLSFSVTRECASLQAAEAFCLTHPRDLQRADTVLIVAQGNRGAVTNLAIGNAVVENVQCRQIGVTVQISYTLTGGAIT